MSITADAKGTALVTGASTGIGAAYADRLAKRGHDLVLVARDTVRLEANAARLRKDAGVTIEVLAADLTDRAGLIRVEQRLREADITMLVNNAGIAIPGAMAGIDPERLEAMLLLNVVTTTRLARAVAPGMIARKRGTIVNIGSVVGINPDRPGISAAYTASKAFVLALTEGLAHELHETGVQVQAVLPGITRTEIWSKAGIDAEAKAGSRMMEAGDMVDAALAGLDTGELVTIPALPDIADWHALKTARDMLSPNLSHRLPAERYRTIAAKERRIVGDGQPRSDR